MQRLLLLFVVPLFIIGCQPKKSAGEMTAEKNRMLTQEVYDGFNANDWNKVGTVIPENFTEHSPEPGQKPGLEGLKEMFVGYRTAFPDMKMVVNKIVAEGDMVVIYSTVTGTNTGPFMGMPATGKPITIEGYDMMRFSNGKSVEHWGLYDNAKMMMQLGLMPAPSEMKNEEMKK